MFDAGKNYKALKSASKVTVTKSGDTVTTASSSGRSGLKIVKDLSKILKKF